MLRRTQRSEILQGRADKADKADHLSVYLFVGVSRENYSLDCPSISYKATMLGFGVPVNTICLAGSEWFVTPMSNSERNKLTICWSLYNTASYSQEIWPSNVVTIDFCLNSEIFKEEKNISKVNNSEAKRADKESDWDQKKTCSIILVVTISSFISGWDQRKCSLPPAPSSTSDYHHQHGVKIPNKDWAQWWLLAGGKRISKISSDLQALSLLDIWQ